MSKYALYKILEHLRQELTLTEAKAREIRSRFKLLCRDAEYIKIDALQKYLEERKKSAARERGIDYLIKDKKMVRDSLLIAAGSFILGGLLTRDKFGALTAGMSGFDGVIQGVGESKWYVLLGKKISVVPEEMIFPQATGIAFDSFCRMLEELKRRALAGEKLGNLDDIVSQIMKKTRLS